MGVSRGDRSNGSRGSTSPKVMGASRDPFGVDHGMHVCLTVVVQLVVGIARGMRGARGIHCSARAARGDFLWDRAARVPPWE